jgi:hypothetical protein
LGAGFVPTPNQYLNARSRGALAFSALGRVELDARTQSPWGTLRTFARVDAFYGSGASAQLGGLGQLVNTFNAGSTAARETTIVNKAFIQFAGLTAGRAQSMFDFYVDAYNYENLRGSNAIVALLAYTATFGNDFSATLSFEDQPSCRAAIGSTIAATTAAPITIGGVSATSFQAQPGGPRGYQRSSALCASISPGARCIGAEFIYVHLNQTRPAGLAPDFGPASLTATGLPAFHPNTSVYEVRLRIQRAF